MSERREQPDGRADARPRRIRSWHSPKPDDSAPAVFATDARTRRLARLVPLWPSEIESTDVAAAEHVVAALERALRGERRRGRAGHWSYDLNRHMALSRALREERARLASLRRGRPADETASWPGGGANRAERKSLPLDAC